MSDIAIFLFIMHNSLIVIIKKSFAVQTFQIKKLHTQRCTALLQPLLK